MGFNESSENYLNSSDHKAGSDLTYFADKFSEVSFERALDIACAAGHFANTVNADTKVICDMSHNMLKTAKDAFGFDNSAVCAAEFLPFKSDSFDFAGCRIAMHHFRNPCMFIGETYRVLRNGGVFVLIDSVVDEGDEYMNRLEFVRDVTHRKSHTAEHIIGMAECEGFECKDFALFHKRHNFSEWADRLHPTPQQRAQIEDEFLALPDGYKKQYSVEIDNGLVMSYTDKKGLFVFVKP